MRIIGAMILATVVAAGAAQAEDPGARALAEAMERRFLERYGMASAIETVCQDYEANPAMQAGLAIFGAAYRQKAILLQKVAEATAAAAEAYNLKAGDMQFCFRALAEHGPDSADGLVVRKDPGGQPPSSPARGDGKKR